MPAFTIAIEERGNFFFIKFHDSFVGDRKARVASEELIPRLIEETTLMFPYLTFFKEYLILDRNLFGLPERV